MNSDRCWFFFAILLASLARGATGDTLRPGVASVQFHSASLTRPASRSVDAQINLETGNQINDYSRLWLGSMRAPVTGELTLLAEADNGCRLKIGGKVVIDGWTQTVREGRLSVRQGELLPLRLEFFQQWGTAFMRLRWSWKGHPSELVPASALFHTAADEAAITQIMGPSKPALNPSHTPTPPGPLENRACIYGTPEAAEVLGRPAGAIVLKPGPHLFVDDYLVESSRNVTRVVQQPSRDPGIPSPLITGPEDRCFQPFFTVLRDKQSGRFRIWYGAHTEDKRVSASHIGYLESEDGVDWKRPTRILNDPAPIQFGSEVMDEGPDFPKPEQRYKYGWWHGGGLHVAISADGFQFKPLVPDVVLAHDHDIDNLWRDPLRNRYVATVSSSREIPHCKGPRRTTLQAVSEDLIHWSPAWIALAADDRSDKDFAQFYAMSGFLVRGDLIIGMVKVLHDDWKAEGAPDGAFGVGYTALAWTRDGEYWIRDREIFFGADPKPGSWDHAHAWIDEQLPVGNQVYLYYAGYKWGHKHNRFEERQIGLVKMQRDRYVARTSGVESGKLLTPPVVLHGAALTVNANIAGELRVRLLAESGQVLPGFDWVSLHGDRMDHPVGFQRSLPTLAAGVVRLEFQIQSASLFGFDLLP